MLILTRKIGESIVIGDDIKITVVNIEGSQVRLGINAPRSIAVHREEVYERIVEENKMAVNFKSQDFKSLASNLKSKSK